MTELLAEVESLAPTPAVGIGTFRMARVNLLPPEIEQSRRLRTAQGRLAGGLVAVVTLLGAGYAYEVHARHDAETELARVQAQTTVLQREQAKYADVPRTVAAIDAAETARQTAMANDVEWSRTLTSLSLTIPEKVWFSTLTLTVGSATTSAGGATSAGAATSAAVGGTPGSDSGIGTVSVQGQARSHRDVATWLDTLAEQPGMSNPYFSSSQKDKIGTKSVVKFSSTATLTDEALSHLYDRKQG